MTVTKTTTGLLGGGLQAPNGQTGAPRTRRWWATASVLGLNLWAPVALAAPPSPEDEPEQSPAGGSPVSPAATPGDGAAAGRSSAEVGDNTGEAVPPQEDEAIAPVLTRFFEATLPVGTPPTEARLTVLVELTVTASGRTEDVVVIGAAPAPYGAAVRAAVAQFQFQPARVAGKAAAVRIRYEYVFEPVGAEGQLPQGDAAASAAAPAQAEPSVPSAAEHAVGGLEGHVYQRGTRKPLIGATVMLPGIDATTLTDREGRFRFEQVPVGKVSILVRDAEHVEIEDTERISQGQVTDITYYAAQSTFGQDDLMVVGRRDQKVVTRRTMVQREVLTVPGANGDVLAAAQNLPGVNRTFGISRVPGDRLVFRGESSGRAYVNGFAVLNPYHFDGLRSAIGSGSVESMRLEPGNYGARYGHSTSGIIDITTARPATDGLHGFAQIDVFDASLRLEGPISDHASVSISGRRSYIDGILGLVLGEEEKEAVPAAPRYYDLQGSYDYRHAGHSVQFNVFASDDKVALVIDEPPESEPSLRGKVKNRAQWVMAQALWNVRFDEQTQWRSGLAVTRNHYAASLGQQVEADFVSYETGLRSELNHTLAPWISFRGGLNLETQHYNYDVVAPAIADEGQGVPNLSTQDLLTTSELASTYNPAVHVALDLEFGSLALSPAVRVDHFTRRDELAGDTLVQPRLDVRWAATDSFTAKGSAGLYSRAPWIYQSNQDFGNPELTPDRSIQASAGMEYWCDPLIHLDVVGFYNHLYDQISAVPDPERRYDNTGSGRAYGAEFLLKHEPGERFYGWIAYTLARSERKESGRSSFELADYDQTHNLNVVGQYRISHNWELGARFRYVTGNPLTPVASATFDSDNDVYAPLFGPINSARNGAFHQLDVRVDRHFIFDTWKMTAYLDLQNAYNHSNPEARSYNYDYSRHTASAGLPIIPTLGLRGEF